MSQEQRGPGACGADHGGDGGVSGGARLCRGTSWSLLGTGPVRRVLKDEEGLTEPGRVCLGTRTPSAEGHAGPAAVCRTRNAAFGRSAVVCRRKGRAKAPAELLLEGRGRPRGGGGGRRSRRRHAALSGTAAVQGRRSHVALRGAGARRGVDGAAAVSAASAPLAVRRFSGARLRGRAFPLPAFTQREAAEA